MPPLLASISSCNVRGTMTALLSSLLSCVLQICLGTFEAVLRQEPSVRAALGR